MEKIEQLFRQHYSKMFLVSRMILGDEETARDVVSDIFCRFAQWKASAST